MSAPASYIPIHFYDNVGTIKNTASYKKLKERINEAFPYIVYNEEQYELFYYSEKDNEKKVIKDQASLKEFAKEFKESTTKKHIFNLIDKKYEYNLVSTSNIAETIYKSEMNPKNNDSMVKINDSINEVESEFITNASKIFEKACDVHEKTITNQLEEQLTISFMKIPETSKIIDIDKYIDCSLCCQKILTKAYYKCLDCTFNVCKDCYYRFQEQNFHPHVLNIAIQNKESNILLSSNNKNASNKIDYKYEEIEDLISKANPRYEDEDEYLCEVIQKDEINAKYEENKKENLYDVKVTYKNLGSKTWKDNVTFRKVLERDNWFKKGRNFMFEYVVSRKPHVNPQEKVTINFKINVAGKSPGDYFCVLGLKRGDSYIIKGSICVFKIHINLIADDYS